MHDKTQSAPHPDKMGRSGNDDLHRRRLIGDLSAPGRSAHARLDLKKITRAGAKPPVEVDALASAVIIHVMES